MLWLPWATHRKVWHKMEVWTATRAGWPSKRPFCAILFYASPRATKACETRLLSSACAQSRRQREVDRARREQLIELAVWWRCPAKLSFQPAVTGHTWRENAPQSPQKINGGWWILPGSRTLGHLVLILGRRADHHMIFHIFSIPFLPWVFRRRLFKVLRKKMKSTVLQIALTAGVKGDTNSNNWIFLPADSCQWHCLSWAFWSRCQAQPQETGGNVKTRMFQSNLASHICVSKLCACTCSLSLGFIHKRLASR